MSILLVTPPFTQLNTPYPATAYIKGFLRERQIESFQADLGIEVILRIFSKEGLSKVFLQASERMGRDKWSDMACSLYKRQKRYVKTIDPVIRFLQNQDPTLAHNICSRSYLPEGPRFQALREEDVEWAFGAIGLQDRARHFATLYLEDLSDFIKEVIDPHFGFSRYAERLGRSASSFDELDNALGEPETLITEILLQELEAAVQASNPSLVCLSVPFPGNLFGALKCGQYIKKHYPNTAIALGGGFANTELRRLSDPRFFNYVDYVTLDDGELPLSCLLEHLAGNRSLEQLKRTYSRVEGEVMYCNGAVEKDVPQREVGTPDYAGLPLKQYLSVIEVANPMHRLWSDGRWNKLTLAHGCYWGKCSFCDVSLDYIKRYEPVTATMLCDRIERLIEETGERGFHFVDEAAPPALMRDLAIEIIRRGITVTWWTNIRFEKSFTPDLCKLLKASGCIAVSGGLEVASDRLLELMKKGVTVAQVARVANAFTQAGIMVHAYLMYGFPTQTDRETIDSLEMVRQLFEANVLQSGFWHQFAMTAHSPVGMNPEAYQVQEVGPKFAGFADNDRFHKDAKGAQHEKYSEGLRISLFNYMHGIGFNMPLKDWFDFRTPKPSVPKDYIIKALHDTASSNIRSSNYAVWVGEEPEITVEEMETPEGDVIAVATWRFYGQSDMPEMMVDGEISNWLQSCMPSLMMQENDKPLTIKGLSQSWDEELLGNFQEWIQEQGGTWERLRDYGLALV